MGVSGDIRLSFYVACLCPRTGDRRLGLAADMISEVLVFAKKTLHLLPLTHIAC